jgi:hypothetical protein
MSKPFSDHNLTLGEDAVNHVIERLESLGYKILRNELSREFSKGVLNSQQSGELAKFPGLAFDLFIGTKGKENAYLVQIKGKAKDIFKTWVDRVAYNNYWTIAKHKVPFLYFIWIKENDTIYRHQVISPRTFVKSTDSDGKPIYLIPENLIHAAKLDEDTPLGASRSTESLISALKIYKRRKFQDLE